MTYWAIRTSAMGYHKRASGRHALPYTPSHALRGGMVPARRRHVSVTTLITTAPT